MSIRDTTFTTAKLLNVSLPRPRGFLLVSIESEYLDVVKISVNLSWDKLVQILLNQFYEFKLYFIELLVTSTHENGEQSHGDQTQLHCPHPGCHALLLSLSSPSSCHKIVEIQVQVKSIQSRHSYASKI